MFMKKNLIKKASLVIASLALILPLASVSSTSVSAHRIHHHAKVVRVWKHHGKRYNKSFYKHYNKRNRKHVAKRGRKHHMRVGATTSYNKHVNAALNQAPKNRFYNMGFNDALNAKVNQKLTHNANYEKGYVQIIALDNYTDPTGKQLPTQLSKSALKSATTYYNYCVLK